MSKYKTVKEVCALTGLTGKHLYYFHHEKVVRAAAYANYSVEGNDGYKLYDDAGVAKLRQIAVYYQLGLKRNEIRDLMLDPDYDMDRALDHLLQQEREKERRIMRNIAALECLSQIGFKNAIASISGEIRLEKLGQMLLTGQQERTAVSESEQDTVWKELRELMDELTDLGRTEADQELKRYLTTHPELCKCSSIVSCCEGSWQYCSNCGALLNAQLGFTSTANERLCAVCGEKSNVSEKISKEIRRKRK